MIITPAGIQALFTQFRADFQATFAAAPTAFERIATTVPSSTKNNTYGWLGQFPKFREWVGDRVAKDMKAHGYTIVNKTWESTVDVSRDDIEDDQVGVYRPLFQEMGRAAKSHPDELCFPLLAAGAASLCYDGQNFFDTEHPVYANVDGTGAVTNVANCNLDGNGPVWYLMDCTRALKPLIFQDRRKPELVAMTKIDDESVFNSNTYRFGASMRNNVGFGFWQLCYASNQPLTAANYAAARAAMGAFKADGNRPLGITPNLLVVPTALEGAARKLLVKDENGGNEWSGSAELLVTPWLS